MPPTTKRTSINKDSRLQPYTKKSKASTMSSPITPAAAGPWQPEDDAQLMEARKQSLNWSDISQQYFPTKTANACRKRHERLMDKRHTTEDWEGTKLAEMAAAYVELRERMWRILAQEIGEKWQVVESKCMEKGIKNLTSLGRTAGRRRISTLPIVSEDDPHNDSGIAEEGHSGEPYSASSVAPSHSSKRTISNASSYAPTPLPQYSVLPTSQVPQPNYQSYPQNPSYYQQQQQSIPSIASLLESTRGCANPSAIATTH